MYKYNVRHLKSVGYSMRTNRSMMSGALQVLVLVHCDILILSCQWFQATTVSYKTKIAASMAKYSKRCQCLPFSVPFGTQSSSSSTFLSMMPMGVLRQSPRLVESMHNTIPFVATREAAMAFCYMINSRAWSWWAILLLPCLKATVTIEHPKSNRPKFVAAIWSFGALRRGSSCVYVNAYVHDFRFMCWRVYYESENAIATFCGSDVICVFTNQRLWSP